MLPQYALIGGDGYSLVHNDRLLIFGKDTTFDETDDNMIRNSAKAWIEVFFVVLRVFIKNESGTFTTII